MVADSRRRSQVPWQYAPMGLTHQASGKAVSQLDADVTPSCFQIGQDGTALGLCRTRGCPFSAWVQGACWNGETQLPCQELL